MQRGSRSIAMTRFAPAASSARVSPPGPGPTSITVSSAPAERAMRLVRLRSKRKFCPSAFFGARSKRWTTSRRGGRSSIAAMALSGLAGGEARAEAQGRDQAVGPRHALAGNIEGRAMIRRDAQEGKAERDVHRLVEGDGLDRDQCLVVIHAQGGIETGAGAGMKQRIAGIGPARIDPLALQLRDGRRDDIDLLAPHRAVLARMRVEPGNSEARRVDAN